MHRDGPAPTARSRPVRQRVHPFFIGIAIGLLVVALFALALIDDSFIGCWDEWFRMHDIEEFKTANPT